MVLGWARRSQGLLEPMGRRAELAPEAVSPKVKSDPRCQLQPAVPVSVAATYARIPPSSARVGRAGRALLRMRALGTRRRCKEALGWTSQPDWKEKPKPQKQVPLPA